MRCSRDLVTIRLHGSLGDLVDTTRGELVRLGLWAARHPANRARGAPGCLRYKRCHGTRASPYSWSMAATLVAFVPTASGPRLGTRSMSGNVRGLSLCTCAHLLWSRPGLITTGQPAARCAPAQQCGLGGCVCFTVQCGGGMQTSPPVEGNSPGLPLQVLMAGCFHAPAPKFPCETQPIHAAASPPAGQGTFSAFHACPHRARVPSLRRASGKGSGSRATRCRP